MRYGAIPSIFANASDSHLAAFHDVDGSISLTYTGPCAEMEVIPVWGPLGTTEVSLKCCDDAALDFVVKLEAENRDIFCK